MNTHFKNALDKIVTDEALIAKTKAALEDARNKKPEVVRKQFLQKKFVAMAASFLVVVGLSISGYLVYNSPVAYISLDINPSVELGVNFFNKIVLVEGYNADGKKVLEGSQVVGNDIEQAISTIVLSASDNGFIDIDGSTIISVTSESDDKALGEKIQQVAETGANKALDARHKTASIYKENISIKNRDEARAEGISPGKMNLIRKVQVLDATVTIDQYRDSKVVDIMSDYVNLKHKKAVVKNIKKTVKTSGPGNPDGTKPGSSGASGSSGDKSLPTPASDKTNGLVTAPPPGNPGARGQGGSGTVVSNPSSDGSNVVVVSPIEKVVNKSRQNKKNWNRAKPPKDPISGNNSKPDITPRPQPTFDPRPTPRPQPTHRPWPPTVQNATPGPRPTPRPQPINPPIPGHQGAGMQGQPQPQTQTQTQTQV